MTIHSEIQNAIKRCNLVFLMGAGFSKPLGLPNWRDLIKIITTELKGDYPKDSYISNIVEQMEQGYFTEIEVLDKLKQKHLSRIQDILKKSIDIDFDGKDLKSHEKIWQITNQVVTTNYDNAFEAVLPKKVEKVIYEDGFHIARLSGMERFIFKAHGTIEHPANCVLFSDQYKKLYSKENGAALELFKILSDKVIIFLGFSLNDPFVNELLQLRQTAYGGLKSNNFIITTDDKDFSPFGVEKITDVKNYGKDLDDFLDALLPIREKYPYGLGMLLRGFEREGRDFNEEDTRKKYFEFLVPLEQKPETAEIAEEVKAGEFENVEDKLKKGLEEDLTSIQERKESAAKKAFELGELKELQLKYREALQYYQQAFDLQPEKSLYANNLGLILNILGQYRKAIEYSEKALAIELKLKGNKGLAITICYNNIGLVLCNIGDYRKAVEYFERSLAIVLEIYDDKHPAVGTRYSNLGGAWHKMGDYKKAIEYSEKALAISLETYGTKHPDVATRYNNIGESWEQLGEHKTAIEYFERALTIDLEIYGDNHFETAVRYNNIGGALDSLGNHEKALEYYEKALKIDLEILGDKHPDIARDYNNIGVAFSHLKDFSKAVNYFKKTLAINNEMLGEEHPNTQTTIKNLNIAQKTLAAQNNNTQSESISKSVSVES